MNTHLELHPTTSTVPAHHIADLIDEFCEDLTGIYRAAEQRTGTDPDIDILISLYTQLIHTCQDTILAIADMHTRSWPFRLVRLGAWLFWTSRWAAQVNHTQSLYDLCHHQISVATRILGTAVEYTVAGHDQRVTRMREQAVTSIRQHIATCLHWGERR